MLLSKGEGFNNKNIKINNKDLDKGILSIRYSNNRKLSNNLLKRDYKITKRMVDAIKFNKDIHKLSLNEKNIYYTVQPPYNRNMYFYIAPIIKLLKMVTLCIMHCKNF